MSGKNKITATARRTRSTNGKSIQRRIYFIRDLRAFAVYALAVYGLGLLLLFSSAARAGDLIVQLPDGMPATSATATATGVGVHSDGDIKDGKIRFAHLLADTPYDVQIVLADGTILQGVNMNWYNEEAPEPNPGDFIDDDKKEIQQILEVPSFYNKSDILLVNGDHDRAVVLQQLIRDTAFHSDKGGEVIWRIELGYFKNEYGGWLKLNQVSKVLRRVRYPNHQAYVQATEKIKWTPSLGGISVPKDKTTTVTLPAQTPPATQPAAK